MAPKEKLQIRLSTYECKRLREIAARYRWNPSIIISELIRFHDEIMGLGNGASGASRIAELEGGTLKGEVSHD